VRCAHEHDSRAHSARYSTGGGRHRFNSSEFEITDTEDRARAGERQSEDVADERSVRCAHEHDSRAHSARYSTGGGRHRFNSSEFEITDTEDMAMAAPAITGLSRPIAASGRARTL